MDAPDLDSSAEPDGGWIAAHFGVGTCSSMDFVARGEMGRIFRLRTSTGEYAAKELFWRIPNERETADIVAFTDRCRAAGIAAPRTLATVSGDFVASDPQTGRGWMVQTWVDGVVPSTTDVEVTRWLARQAARIHSLAVEASGYNDSDAELGWYCRVPDDFAEIADSAAKTSAEWAGSLASRVADCAQLAAMANETPIGPTVVTHRDLTNDNVLVGADGGHTLLDWDNAGAHEPWREAGNLCMEHVGDPQTVATLADDYTRAGGRPLPRGVPLFASGAAVWLNFLRTRALLALDETHSADHRSRAAKAIPSLVRDMPSMRSLERAAQAIR